MGKHQPDRRKAGGGKEKEAKGDAKGDGKDAVQQSDPGVDKCFLCHEAATDQPATYVECNVGCRFTVHDRCDRREMEKLTKGISTRKRRMEIFSAHRHKWCWNCSKGKNPVFADCFTAGNRKPYAQWLAEGTRGEPDEDEDGDDGEGEGEGEGGGDGTTSAPSVIGDSESASMAGTESSGRLAGPRPQLGPSSAAGAAAAQVALMLHKLREGREVDFLTRAAAQKYPNLREIWGDHVTAQDCAAILNRAVAADVRGLLRRLGRPPSTEHPPAVFFVQADDDAITAAGAKRGTQALKLTKKAASWFRVTAPPQSIMGLPSTPVTPGISAATPTVHVPAAAAAAAGAEQKQQQQPPQQQQQQQQQQQHQQQQQQQQTADAPQNRGGSGHQERIFKELVVPKGRGRDGGCFMMVPKKEKKDDTAPSTPVQPVADTAASPDQEAEDHTPVTTPPTTGEAAASPPPQSEPSGAASPAQPPSPDAEPSGTVRDEWLHPAPVAAEAKEVKEEPAEAASEAEEEPEEHAVEAPTSATDGRAASPRPTAAGLFAGVADEVDPTCAIENISRATEAAVRNAQWGGPEAAQDPPPEDEEVGADFLTSLLEKVGVSEAQLREEQGQQSPVRGSQALSPQRREAASPPSSPLRRDPPLAAARTPLQSAAAAPGHSAAADAPPAPSAVSSDRWGQSPFSWLPTEAAGRGAQRGAPSAAAAAPGGRGRAPGCDVYLPSSESSPVQQQRPRWPWRPAVPEQGEQPFDVQPALKTVQRQQHSPLARESPEIRSMPGITACHALAELEALSGGAVLEPPAGAGAAPGQPYDLAPFRIAQPNEQPAPRTWAAAARQGGGLPLGGSERPIPEVSMPQRAAEALSEGQAKQVREMVEAAVDQAVRAGCAELKQKLLEVTVQKDTFQSQVEDMEQQIRQLKKELRVVNQRVQQMQEAQMAAEWMGHHQAMEYFPDMGYGHVPVAYGNGRQQPGGHQPPRDGPPRPSYRINPVPQPQQQPPPQQPQPQPGVTVPFAWSDQARQGQQTLAGRGAPDHPSRRLAGGFSPTQ